jgi:hypothetical protein
MAKPHLPDKLPALLKGARVQLTPVGASRGQRSAIEVGIVRSPDDPWYEVQWPSGEIETIHRGWLQEVV